MDEQQIIAKCIGVVSVEPALIENQFPAVALCIDDGSDRYHEYFLTNLQEVRSLIALLLLSLAHHGDQRAADIYQQYTDPGELPENP